MPIEKITADVQADNFAKLKALFPELVTEGILRSLRRKLPWLEAPDSYADNTDALDSLIASLTARAAAQGFTHRPGAGAQADLARHEGWIHLPTSFPSS